ncbi:hypothetical protein [Adonisia turfae]|nr:hypothetical protein [Adonisia turfae]
MTYVLLVLLTLVCGGLLTWGLQKKQRMLHYPFLSGAVFAGWVLPQLLGLSTNPDSFPHEALDKTIFMTLLCVGACYVGHYLNKKPFSKFHWSFNRQRLLIAATLLSLGGSYFFYRVSALADETVGLWTGIITIFVFLSSLLSIGLALSLAIHIRQPSRWSTAIIIFDVAFYLHRIVFWGRRRFLVELVLMIGLALWFRYRKLPPRLMVIAALIAGALWINSIGDYRAAVMSDTPGKVNAINQIDFVGNLQNLLTEGGHEMANATYNIAAFDSRGNFDLGVSHWNRFVHLYIPGQLIGFDTKESIKIQINDSASELFYHEAHTGSTATGISDSFQSFWYFGAIKFLIISYIMRSFFRAGNQGHFLAQVLLMLVFPGSLEAITHNTDRFFMLWPRLIAFLGPAILYSKVKN